MNSRFVYLNKGLIDSLLSVRTELRTDKITLGPKSLFLEAIIAEFIINIEQKTCPKPENMMIIFDDIVETPEIIIPPGPQWRYGQPYHPGGNEVKSIDVQNWNKRWSTLRSTWADHTVIYIDGYHKDDAWIRVAVTDLKDASNNFYLNDRVLLSEALF